MRRRQLIHLSPIFWVKEQSCLMCYIISKETLESPFPKKSKLHETITMKLRPKMPQNEHVYVICCQLEADDDVISYRNVKTIKG